MKARPAIALFITWLLFLGCANAAVIQEPDSSQDLRVQRLAGLCRLWGAIKFFHPYLAYKAIDWDQALVQSIPRVQAAVSAKDYQEALDHLLSYLHDPTTRTIREGSASSLEAGKDIKQAPAPGALTLKWIKDNIALISIHDYFQFTNQERASELSKIMNDASSARAVILDLRRSDGSTSSGEDSSTYYFARAFLQGLPVLFSGECPLPSTRHRLYSGYPTQVGDTSGGYYSGFVYSQEAAINGKTQKSENPNLIFLTDGYPNGVESQLGGLQSSGRAVLIQEGNESPEMESSLHVLTLPEGIAVQIRTTEAVNPDGSAGFSADISVPGRTAASDPALTAAMDVAVGKRVVSRTKMGVLPPNPPLIRENSYPEMTYPAEEYRLLSLFRFWNVIHYFFPYKDLMDRPWEDVLETFIPRFQRAKDALDYTLLVMELVTNIDDTHGFSFSPVFMNYLGTHRPPIEVKWIEDQSVVTQVSQNADRSVPAIRVGDVVLAVDGEDIAVRRNRLSRYFAASTPQALQWRVHQNILNGAENSAARIKYRNEKGETSEIVLTRTVRFLQSQRKTPVYAVLPDGFGYMDLVRLQVPDVDKAFETVKNTAALIMDMRGYPQGTAWTIGPRLADKKTVVARFGTSALHAITPDWPFRCTFEATTEPNEKWRYPGKIVVLINEEAISQAEHTCLFLEATAKARFIGSPTNGANGDVTRTVLPGGIMVNFTGLEVRHADGRQLQRVGIQPDVLVRPTIAGIRQGHDEVLERAIQELKKDQ